MGKYITIQIPKSCQQDWNAMTLEEQGRHCNACQKTVVDFTTMTDTQLATFFKKKTDNVCGRFYNDQLDKQIALPKRELPWLKYFFTITLPAFLFSQKSFGQKKESKEKIVLADKKITNKIADNTTSTPLLDVKKDSVVLLEEVVIRSPISQRIGSYTMGYSISLKKTSYTKEFQKKEPIVLSNTNNISLFPNPIIPNSKLNIVWDNAVFANQYIEIFDSKGNLVKKEMVTISVKTKTAFVIIKKIAAAIYFIKVTDANTKIKLSKGFIVN
jgi:Secretion system C-terminal sorting domain